MKIVFLSDTHNRLGNIRVPDGDMLIHCGDFCGSGTLEEVARFNEQMNELSHQYKIVVAGNHDWPFETNNDLARSLLTGMIYLQDELVEIEGLRIYGSPWQPQFRDWAFNLPRRSDQLKSKWDRIPENIDILITHGPPHGILDCAPFFRRVGCELLRERVMKLKPRIHCFGHIHLSYGMEKHEGTIFINAANLDELYRPVNKPIVIELD